MIEAKVDDDFCLFDGHDLVIESNANPCGRIGAITKTLHPLSDGEPMTGVTITGRFLMSGDIGAAEGELTETWVTR